MTLTKFFAMVHPHGDGPPADSPPTVAAPCAKPFGRGRSPERPRSWHQARKVEPRQLTHKNLPSSPATSCLSAILFRQYPRFNGVLAPLKAWLSGSRHIRQLSRELPKKPPRIPSTRETAAADRPFDGRNCPVTPDPGPIYGASLTFNDARRGTRGFRRRAVIVGVNYVGVPEIQLCGSCNDASAVAFTLMEHCGFSAREIVLLMDALPSYHYIARDFSPSKSGTPPFRVTDKGRQPTRRNILLALHWLCTGSQPGDVLFFYFAGHGIQLEDMSCWEGEGYDEGILPMDLYGQGVNALTTLMIRNLLLSVSNDVQVTVVLDCNGGQTMLDPTGTGSRRFIKGVKQRGLWPLITDATDKVSRAVYDPTPWVHPAMQKRRARPRFVPGVPICSAQHLIDPALEKLTIHLGSRLQGYLFASAPWSQSAIEAQLPPLTLHNSPKPCSSFLDTEPVIHGVFTWCFLSSIKANVALDMRTPRTITFIELLGSIKAYIKTCIKGGLSKLQQSPELTYYRLTHNKGHDLFLVPYGRSPLLTPSPTQGPRVSPPALHEYVSIWDAENQLTQQAEWQRAHNPSIFCTGTTL